MTTKSAVDLLQEQIEAVRREAFAAGYEAAMALIREAASRPAPDMAGPAPAPAPSAAPPHRRRRRAAAPPAPPRQRRAGRRLSPLDRAARRPPRRNSQRPAARARRGPRLHLDPPGAGPARSPPGGRAGRRQQDLAPPRLERDEVWRNRRVVFVLVKMWCLRFKDGAGYGGQPAWHDPTRWICGSGRSGRLNGKGCRAARRRRGLGWASAR